MQSGAITPVALTGKRYSVTVTEEKVIEDADAKELMQHFERKGYMVQVYAAAGADFSEAATDAEKLDVIEAFEDAQKGDPTESTAEERTAAALEALVMNNMETVNTDDPDAE